MSGGATMYYIFKYFFFMVWMFSICSASSCNYFPNITNAELQLEELELPVLSGSTIKYQCDNGYRPERLPSLVSCKNGTWLVSEDMCRPVNCGYPGAIENANQIGNTFTFPHNVTYVCKEGYRIKGSPTIFCSPSKSWSPSTRPLCEAIICPQLLQMENGRYFFLGDDRRYKSVVTYVCNRNYHLEGNAIRVCQNDATWNGTVPTCVATTCPNPGPVPHGRFFVEKSVYKAGDVIIFKCDFGDSSGSYGHYSSKCLENGSWQNPPPECAEPVTEAPIITTTSVDTTVTENLDYIKDSSSCHDPGDIRNGKRTITDFKPSSNVTYSCEVGYELRGDGTLFCLPNGKWNLEKLPICVKPIPVSMIIGTVLGVVALVVLGVSGFFLYRWREKKIRGYGKKSKALTADAADLEEITGLDKGKKPIPVTVL